MDNEEIMDSDDEKREEEQNGWEFFGKSIAALLAVLGLLLIGAVVWVNVFGLNGDQENTKGENAFQSYRSAVKLCGEGNTRKHDYVDGTTDFDCADYSIVGKPHETAKLPEGL